jgi:hypothetical protein
MRRHHLIFFGLMLPLMVSAAPFKSIKGDKPGKEKISGTQSRKQRHSPVANAMPGDTLASHFAAPPKDCRPNLFWDWMGGMLSKEGIRKDLEAMAKQGIGGVMVMQMPDQATDGPPITLNDYPGKVRCLSDEWFNLVNYAIGKCDSLGITFSIFMSPGWSHAGGPWVTPEHGLKKYQSTEIEVNGPEKLDKVLPRGPRLNGGGTGTGNPNGPSFYKDITVLAVPVSDSPTALNQVVDVSAYMDADGRLKWDVPAGKWKIVRVGITSENGVNHPAPPEATGLECDRMDTAAVRIVFNGEIKRILAEARAKGYHSFKAFETDSYEGGYQDFSMDFIDQFKLRRGYDCTPWLPAYNDSSIVIGSPELTQRFRNDMSLTCAELIAERFHGQLRHLADEYKVGWMIEPYFLMPIDWRMSGAHSNMVGSEFWVNGTEPEKSPPALQTNAWATLMKTGQLLGAAPDIAALYGLKKVWAESFTAESYRSAWRNDPNVLKPWGDAAFCRGINEMYMHGFTLNPFDDRFKPGISMGFWGTQMTRNATWWPYAAPWHHYLAHCLYMLRQGRPVNDVLAYPSKIEPNSSMDVNSGPYRQIVMDDDVLFNRIWVQNGRVYVKGGGDFAALTLAPGIALRPEALRKIRDLVRDGATLIADSPPATSPSLQNYPACDQEVTSLEKEIWGAAGTGEWNEHTLGKGHVYATGNVAAVLGKLTGGPDVQFKTADPAEQGHLDFVHRRNATTDIYFVCNTGLKPINTTVEFRADGRVPELWDPVTAKIESISGWQAKGGRTIIPMRFDVRQSFFVVFRKAAAQPLAKAVMNAPKPVMQIAGAWNVSFDPKWGGPKNITFNTLQDWSTRPETGIKYYSGTAVYTKIFDMKQAASASKLYLNLGEIHNIARITLNGHDLGILWCAPWQLEIPAGVLKPAGNKLTIVVVNTWVNRLIGDEQLPDDVDLVSWNPNTDHAGDFPRKGSYDVNIGSHRIKYIPEWVTNDTERPKTGRYTFTSWRFYNKDAPLLPAGLIGPVTITKD